MKSSFAEIILDQGIDRPLDYAILPSQTHAISIGSRVLVPLRRNITSGTVIKLKETSAISKALPIHAVTSEGSLISKELMTLAEWMSLYYCCSLRRVLKIFFPPSVRKDMPIKQQWTIKRVYSLEKTKQHCLEMRQTHPTQSQVLETLLHYPKGLLLTKLIEKASVSNSPIETLIRKGILKKQKIQIDRSPLENTEFFQTKPKTLNPEQKQTLNHIQTSLHQKSFSPHLLYGVTGSGKTEVYLQAIQHARENQLGVIMLVPEIALTSQTIERFRSRFQEKLGILHHRLSDGQRYDIWHALQKGEIQIVIGARSAIFSPMKNLGLIIVDEEHENSYKQTEDTPCYHARDIAMMRGKIEGLTVLLGSATPSIETYYNAQKGKYALNTLQNRAQQAKLPQVTLIDMKQEFQKAGGYTLFSEPLIKGIKSRFERGEQTLLFLNRRGYHSYQTCSQCGESVKCSHCDITLTFHKKTNQLLCHLCGYTLSPPPQTCLSCKQQGTLSFKGVGTEHLERSLHALFPQIRTLRMDADTTRHKGSHDLLFKQFRSGKADVLIGTQMIAKGLHFPAVTLVGVLNSDHTLHLPDFRSSEHTFQLLTQVAGRSGRSSIEGEVIIQTMMQNHPIFSYASSENYLQFFEEELKVRELFHYPPFNRLAKLTFSGKDEHKTLKEAHKLYHQLLLTLPSTFSLFSVIPSGHAKIKDKYRFKLIIKGPNMLLFSSSLKNLLQKNPLPSSVHLLVDIDPLSTFF